jgi:hypothetical protein
MNGLLVWLIFKKPESVKKKKQESDTRSMLEDTLEQSPKMGRWSFQRPERALR